MTSDCPICNKLYAQIRLSEHVCPKHLDWFVTKCSGCGKFVFSDCRGVCPDCAPAPDDDYGMIERNALFREIGLKRG